MSIAYAPRSESNKITVTQGQTLRQLLQANGLSGKLDTLSLYNWGTKKPAEINRALVELIGCSKIADDPLDSVLNPTRGTKQAMHKPELWTAELASNKKHSIKLKRRLPPTAVSITELTALFNPESETCTVRCLFEGDATRATKRDFEVHATEYYSVGNDRDGNEVEKPCGTDAANKPEHTHIVCKNKTIAPGAETITWNGISDATEGVLKNPAKITSRCAPYMILMRYYKDVSDKDARLKIEPFYPCWRLTGNAKYEIDESSLVVRWTVEAKEASKEKLKIGHLAIHDKDGIAFFAPLTKDQINAGSYNLLKGPVKWNKSQIDRKKFPYRAQIQIHSDADEDNGLAIATMPTQMPVFEYKKVQLIGFNVRNDTNSGDYLGHATHENDIQDRCNAMIEAVKLAHQDADTGRDILKVFVAPEFYFRGKQGAYPVEKISTIMPKLRVETDKHKYLDWLFVFGTAIGRHKHESGSGSKITHGEAIHRVKITTVESSTKISARVWSKPQKGWVFQKGATKTKISNIPTGAGILDQADGSITMAILLDDTSGLSDGDDAEMIEPVMTIADTKRHSLFNSTKTRIKVASKFCSQIPIDPATKEVVTVAGERWEATSEGLKSTITKVDFKETDGSYWLTLDPGGAYNTGKPLKLLEPIATEVFNVALVQKGWHAPQLGDGSLREIVIYKENISPIDFIRNKNLDWHKRTGENRKIKIDGSDNRPVLPTNGSTDISGASPNRDRLSDSAVGSEINLSGLGGGCVFTVNGVTLGLEVCLDHAKDRLWNFYKGPNKRKNDPMVQVQLIPSWGMSIGGSDPGKEVMTIPNGLVFNVDGSRMESVARVCDSVYSCDSHPSKTGNVGNTCDQDASLLSAGVVYFKCTQDGPKPRYYSAACPTHGKQPCGKKLQKLGTAFAASTTKSVPLSDNTTYFKKQGNVQVFPAKPLPNPDVVP
jgi:hypothetical protein